MVDDDSEFPGGALLGVTGKFMVREGPKAINWLVTKLQGQKIVVIGPPGSGKTSFIEFLRWGTRVRDGASVPPTQQTETAHTVFRIMLGKNSQLEFSVSKVVDTAGHDGPSKAAAEIVRLKPSMIILLFSVHHKLKQSPEETHSIEGWLNIFCERLSDNGSRTVASLLEKSFILVNKTDLRAKSTVRKVRSGIKPVMREWLTNEKVAKAIQKIPILDCSLVEGEPHEATADNVVEEIAKAIARNGRKAA